MRSLPSPGSRHWRPPKIHSRATTSPIPQGLCVTPNSPERSATDHPALPTHRRTSLERSGRRTVECRPQGEHAPVRLDVPPGRCSAAVRGHILAVALSNRGRSSRPPVRVASASRPSTVPKSSRATLNQAGTGPRSRRTSVPGRRGSARSSVSGSNEVGLEATAREAVRRNPSKRRCAGR